MSIARSIRTALAAAALAAAAFTATATVGSTEAEARRVVVHIGHGFHGHHWHGHHRPYYVPYYNRYSHCGWLLAKANVTGSPYWYNRYYGCTGGY